MFEFSDDLDVFRSWPTGRLVSERDAVVRQQRQLRMKELASARVLDERGQIDATVGRDGESARTVREKLETARALESLPAVAAAAYAGRLSSEQLRPVVALADEQSDAEWARRAPNVAPADLARLARTKVKPTLEEGRARYAARSLRMWWTKDTGMLHLHGQLPDVMGAKVERTIQRTAERAKPPKGQAWDSFEHRAADALAGMCDAVAVAERVETPTMAAQPLLVVEVPQSGPAEVAGIPLPDAMVEAAAGERADRTGPRRRSGPPHHRRQAVGRSVTQGPAGGDAARRPLPHPRLRDQPRAPRPSSAPEVVGRHRRPRQPRHGLRRRRPPPDARPPRTVGPRRQPQPTRRAAARARGRPHGRGRRSNSDFLRDVRDRTPHDAAPRAIPRRRWRAS